MKIQTLTLLSLARRGILLGAAVSVVLLGACKREAMESGPLTQRGYMVEAPEFHWDLEVKRLASAYHPDEKFLTASTGARDVWGSEAVLESLGSLTSDADSADFAAALKAGAIAPPDAAKATEQHEAARGLLAAKELAEALPEEFDSEFADYHRGAFAYRLGKDHWDEARAAWEALLKRPEAQRHYRSVWATFMLGKIAMKREEAGAVKWFQQTRALAKAGFADSIGLAADSYGWEARSEWKQGHPEKAAPLYLNYYYILETRCWKTKVAAATLERGAFVEQSGPWSTEEEAARNARAE